MTRAALAVGLAWGTAAGVARAHEPFEITADARTSPAETTLRLLIAGRTAALLCGARPVEKNAEAWRRCGGALFTVTGARGQRLTAAQIDVRVTVEDDVAVTLTYPGSSPGVLRFEATFLRHLPDPLYGAQLTVTGPGVFLGQRLLRADAPTAAVIVPSPPGK